MLKFNKTIRNITLDNIINISEEDKKKINNNLNQNVSKKLNYY